jgi:hypothetical protein
MDSPRRPRLSNLNSLPDAPRGCQIEPLPRIALPHTRRSTPSPPQPCEFALATRTSAMLTGLTAWEHLADEDVRRGGPTGRGPRRPGTISRATSWGPRLPGFRALDTSGSMASHARLHGIRPRPPRRRPRGTPGAGRPQACSPSAAARGRRSVPELSPGTRLLGGYAQSLRSGPVSTRVGSTSGGQQVRNRSRGCPVPCARHDRSRAKSHRRQRLAQGPRRVCRS